MAWPSQRGEEQEATDNTLSGAGGAVGSCKPGTVRTEWFTRGLKERNNNNDTNNAG
jgi:hypothetical protein